MLLKYPKYQFTRGPFECGTFDSCSLMGPISPSLIEPHPSAEKLTLQDSRASIINIKHHFEGHQKQHV